MCNPFDKGVEHLFMYTAEYKLYVLIKEQCICSVLHYTATGVKGQRVFILHILITLIKTAAIKVDFVSQGKTCS